MIKRLILCVAALLAAISMNAQRVSIFGLEIGGKYSVMDIVSAVGNRGSYADASMFESNTGIGEYLNVLAFMNVRVGKDGVCPLMLFRSLNDATLFNVSMNYSKGDNLSAEALQAVFDGMKSKFPGLSRVGTSDDGAETYVLSEPAATSVRVNVEREEAGGLSNVEVIYYDSGSLKKLLAAIEAMPEIQDEFYGLKFGSRTYMTSLTKAVGDRGRYERMVTQDGYKLHIFRDIAFAGKVWDYGEFGVLADGNSLFSFKVYNSYTMKGADKKESEKLYGDYKAKLMSKYGTVVENAGEYGDKSVLFDGSNGASVSLFNESGRCSDGSAGRFVGLDYYVRSAVSSLMRQASREL